MPLVAKVEPLTTARVLRGPFDYVCPEGAGVGSVLVVPFGGRDVVGVVTATADHSEHDLAEPRRVLDASLTPDLVELALWLGRDYCSTPARALSLLLPPKGTKPKTAAWARAARDPADERLTDRQRALLATLPRFAGGDLAALRRLEARGRVAV
ncbi:MAG: primosomal protein N' family DNA-binding protein, partial [Solirubrobacteraceae bacterium]